MIFEKRIIILLLASVILASAAVLSMGFGNQYYSWDDDDRKGYTTDYTWWAYAYVGAWCVPNAGYFDFTHKSSGGGTYYFNPNVQFYSKIQPWGYTDGGYTRTLVYMKLGGDTVGPIGYAIAGIGKYTGIK